jgi:hypothetical protein
MLGTRERTLLLESLRPPAGLQLGRAVGTSYTLDLIALLTAPLAFTFFDVHDSEGSPVADPVALLEALRRNAQKVTLFCQAGAISVPRPEQALLAYLEGSVVEVRAPMEAGLFHPKVWVMEFTAEGEPVVYRFLCLSRNLTFDRAWDTCLCLEGRLTRRKRGYTRNGPLADFLTALPERAVRPQGPALRAEVRRIAEAVRRVDFQVPEPFEDFAVHPLGLAPGHSWPFPASERALAVSPYLAAPTVSRLKQEHGLEVLIARPEAIDEVRVHSREGSDALPEQCFVLAPSADLDARESDDDGASHKTEAQGASPAGVPELTGLHAKLFLMENGPETRLFTGSANATNAAFGLNVELMVELIGPTKLCGIDALLGDEEDPRLGTIRSLLQRYAPEAPEPVDEERRALERRLDGLARDLATSRLFATASEVGEGQSWNLTLSGRLPAMPAEAGVSVWPVTLSSEHARVVPPGAEGTLATFEGVSFEALTAFFGMEVSLQDGTSKATRRFAVTVELQGAPEDRRERLLRSFLRDRRQVLRLLLLLLMDEGADVSMFIQASHDPDASTTGPFGGPLEATLLESLLRSLDASPDRIDHVARLIEDLDRTAEGRELLPEGLEEIWEPIRAAREELRR